ncbi:acyltransferase [Rouxiella badensis]|uniref:Acyltransferase n=1 Tax=Rouxiella badensis TaxID=1646377 RepID=A0A1X0WHN1_9GAMM|nr:acyltransferase [Rouxiella badensis]MCC3704543.1 acyltransferase [Rouxiella badensis]MCC3746589.1 acyltransferase [Rouxiella badensis]ORJ26305.1 acyltransferase [Rouxiella badensis]WAT03545.1 acyltransferase [Rouxiella badensis]
MQTKQGPAHNNCFDIIRHLAAIMVIYSHHFALSGQDEPTFLGSGTLGSLAVFIFFSISGYLITQSYERRKSNFDYAKKRFLRIYPGLAVCLIFTLYLCCGLFGKAGWAEWALSLEPVKTFIRVMVITGVGVVGVMPSDINDFTSGYLLSNTMNGSLWTLFFEVFDYIVIALFLTVFKNKNLAAFIPLILSAIIQVICVKKGITHLAIIGTSLFTVPFCVGALLYINRDRWINNLHLKVLMLTAGLLVIYFASCGGLLTNVLGPIAICVMTIVIGVSIKDQLIKGRFDFSFGIYIYAFPVQQIVINEMGIPFYASMILSLLITFVLASLSWFLVEKPMIKR